MSTSSQTNPPSVSKAVSELAKHIDPTVSSDAAADLIYNLRNAVLTAEADRIERSNPDRNADFSDGVDWAASALRDARQGGTR